MSAARYSSSAEWVSAVLRMARPFGGWPRYGTGAWLRLKPSDPRFVAAVAVAAEAWHAAKGTDAAVRALLHQEIAAGREGNDQVDAERFATMAAGVRHLASVPTFAELSNRRGEPERAVRAREHARRISEDTS